MKMRRLSMMVPKLSRAIGSPQGYAGCVGASMALVDGFVTHCQCLGYVLWLGGGRRIECNGRSQEAMRSKCDKGCQMVGRVQMLAPQVAKPHLLFSHLLDFTSLHHCNLNLTDISAAKTPRNPWVNANLPCYANLADNWLINFLAFICSVTYGELLNPVSPGCRRLVSGAMPVRELDLGQLSLAHVAGDLWLSVNASGAFNLPSNLSSLNDHELQEALVSGSIWTTRGVACQINIKISFNGKPLDESNRLRVLESLGYQCRDAHVSELCCLGILLIS